MLVALMWAGWTEWRASGRRPVSLRPKPSITSSGEYSNNEPSLLYWPHSIFISAKSGRPNHGHHHNQVAMLNVHLDAETETALEALAKAKRSSNLQ